MKTILLLHGMGGPNPLNKIEDGLKESGQYQIIKPVMPGFRSEDGIIEYTDEKYVEFIEKLRQKLGIETWIVLGYSMGGRTAMNYTFKYPQRVEKLILVDSVGIDYMIPPVKYKWGKPVLKKLLTPALRWGCIQEILGKGDFRDSKSKAYEIGKQWVSNMMKKVVVRKNFVEILTTIAKPIENIEEKLSNLKMKVLLLWAEEDQTAKIESCYYIQKLIQNVQVFVLPDYRHMAPIEKPEFYIRHIKAFI